MTKATKKKSIWALAGFLVISVITAAIAYFDNDPTTQPDLGDVVDKGSDVYDALTAEDAENTED